MSGLVQKNHRLSRDHAGRLAAEASRRGVSEVEVLRAWLDTLPPLEEAPGSDSPPRVPASPRVAAHEVDLAGWLSGRSGMPRALCARAIAGGRVMVQGWECRDERVDVGRLVDVTLDGRAL